jgi:hypothetical protein
MTEALLVPQSPYKMAAARGTSTLRGLLTSVVITCFDSEIEAVSCGDMAPLQQERGWFPELALLMKLTRLAVGLEPLNAPGVAHRAPPSVSPRALGPPLTRISRAIKQNKELRNPPSAPGQVKQIRGLLPLLVERR